ncbi:hypothetical protein Pyn_31462 [Prunus yedoensis var. nudiflora]|uniref:Uncharacterized protein n=1 Tax=Prunus yedoensis var. nudiflora TaxID=2094558 RepID=A0A314ZWH2_PRUYE|nr:hypothetical protein Pyn_31462 [Prunus yedoensis var. nudiflora]
MIFNVGLPPSSTVLDSYPTEFHAYWAFLTAAGHPPVSASYITGRSLGRRHISSTSLCLQSKILAQYTLSVFSHFQSTILTSSS